MVSSASLLPILVRARRVRGLPDCLESIVAGRLRRLGIPWSVIDAEQRAMSPERIGRTVDRSVVGIMVEFANGMPYYIEEGDIDERALTSTEDRLAKTPCFAGKALNRVVFPNNRAVELLVAIWADAFPSV